MSLPSNSKSAALMECQLIVAIRERLDGLADSAFSVAPHRQQLLFEAGKALRIGSGLFKEAVDAVVGSDAADEFIDHCNDGFFPARR